MAQNLSLTNITFSTRQLAEMGKEGILRPDENGYYTMPIGALNTYNSAGAYYTANEAIKLFDSSSILQRRIKSGCLKAEEGHPRREPNWTDEDFIMRLQELRETNICAHFSKISLDFEFGKKNPKFNNPAMIGIIGSFSPSGPYGEALRKSLENGQENVCFSIRSLTRDFYQRGRVIKVLDTIYNWDRVTEPGIDVARKWNSPSLEGMSPVAVETECRVIQLDTLRNAAIRAEKSASGISLESDISKELAIEAYRNASRPITPTLISTSPSFKNW